ncbi:uracil-DNA glycosylase [Scleromatobacter humisilvae]|uniref:Uracil-DNA glycosylase n=1 Tax=Scleromatobacter humisilvae TaxID=2897159 RepID=A0A9X1YHF0_9BURK|nr:uracil-DNA glycosylase [Scleromatobacter humisilvae]MCK9685782.1 uracil-DNA glycosylase [Scleromatobacter humisilvae]
MSGQSDLPFGDAAEQAGVPQVHRADDLPAAFAHLPAAWRALLTGWTPAAEQAVVAAVKAVSGDREIAPPDPFRALRLLAPEDVKVVVFGQDPYPRPGHATGLAFSAGHGKPVSLRRIFEIMKADRPGWQPPQRWVLDSWARQGVLMLNTVLTVEVGTAGAHMNCGWQALTSNIVGVLAVRAEPPTFLLWGKPAQAFFDAACPAGSSARVLRARHPSQDFKREFMADGSHFAATAGQVDWWSLDG